MEKVQDRFTKALDTNYSDEKNHQRNVHMWCTYV